MKAFLLSTLLLASASLRGANVYKPGPDAMVQPGVPQGTVTSHSWASKIFAGTQRSYWIYIPAQYDPAKPACVMVFQDGAGYIKPNGNFRVPIVFDNLINRKEMPVTIGIFIDSGIIPNAVPGKPGQHNRSFEYDTLSDQYSRFLLEEILPDVAQHYALTTDPDGRAICGQSSGGICAFTVAWNRPDAFRKVVSFIGSFTSIAYRPAHDGVPMQPGGDLYPTLIRKNPIKPLRIFLQDGTADLDNLHGNWHLANEQMLSALEWANANADARRASGPRYQINHVWGDGAHNGKHGGAIFPDVMRWLWAGYAPKS